MNNILSVLEGIMIMGVWTAAVTVIFLIAQLVLRAVLNALYANPVIGIVLSLIIGFLVTVLMIRDLLELNR